LQASRTLPHSLKYRLFCEAVIALLRAGQGEPGRCRDGGVSSGDLQAPGVD
jgi:hypothetical protein